MHTKLNFSAVWYMLVLIVALPGCRKEKESSAIINPAEMLLPLTGMLAYYPFDINAKDSGLYGHNGVLMDDARIVPAGKVKGALQLDGSGDYVSINQGLNLSKEFSLSCWIKPDVTTRSDAAIFAKYQTNKYGPYDFYLLYNKAAFWISDGKGSFKIVQSNTAILPNTWTHIVWTAKNNILKIFINGIEESEIESVIPNMTANNDLVTIGRQAHLFVRDGNLEFKGLIDEVRLYERELSNNEIQQLFNQH